MPFCAILDPAGASLEDLRGPAADLPGVEPIYWTEGPVGLVHQRASRRTRIDQPFLGDGRLCCALFEGRLDRRDDLARQLSEAGCLRAERPRPVEIVIAAFERWVEEFPRHLEGEWRALLWDRKDERLLGAAGDGEPLYEVREEGRVAVATHTEALATLSAGTPPVALPAGGLLVASRAGTEIRSV